MFRFLASTFLFGILSILALIGLNEIARRGRATPLRLDREVAIATENARQFVGMPPAPTPVAAAEAPPAPSPSPTPAPVPPRVVAVPTHAEPAPVAEVVNRDAWTGSRSSIVSTTVRTNTYVLPAGKADWKSIVENIRSAQETLTK